ncbi:hypothetical protein HMN09_00559600 [Mycena chlorophos]|uniref:Uncharacterized protein n=1 Tax=Mycena chlorophos TaxID=658473 RepID=A0A8H6WEV0_MYCCL|nr:hypothetical protein HMN09_00559600 [Mycena chlorophos]
MILANRHDSDLPATRSDRTVALGCNCRELKLALKGTLCSPSTGMSTSTAAAQHASWADALRSFDQAREALLQADPRRGPPTISVADAQRREASLRSEIAALKTTVKDQEAEVRLLQREARSQASVVNKQKDEINGLKRKQAEYAAKVADLEEQRETTVRKLKEMADAMRGSPAPAPRAGSQPQAAGRKTRTRRGTAKEAADSDGEPAETKPNARRRAAVDEYEGPANEDYEPAPKRKRTHYGWRTG